MPAGSDTPAAEMISDAACTVFSWNRCTLAFLLGTCRPDMSFGSCVATPVGQWFVPHLSACRAQSEPAPKGNKKEQPDHRQWLAVLAKRGTGGK